MKTHIWFRAESKPQEERSALTPDGAKKLIEKGFRITVEESTERAFPIEDFQAIGCEIATAHTWHNAEPDAIVLGLKELAQSNEPLKHRHVHFAHVYKQQTGWKNTLGRFIDGGGTLYDLEYLLDENGRRVAAFGYWAGFAGTALAIQAWCRLKSGETTVLPPVNSRPGQDVLIGEIAHQLKDIDRNGELSRPRVLVIGSGGRSGRGAVQACESLGLDVTQWDIAETKPGGPFQQILGYDILVNCVFVQKQIPPFLTRAMLEAADRKLAIICDVSCDPYGDYNPLPIYDRCTTFQNPTLAICEGQQPLHLIAIDHLPSMLPVESSLDYCEKLLPVLLQLNDLESPVWKRAETLFAEKCQASLT